MIQKNLQSVDNDIPFLDVNKSNPVRKESRRKTAFSGISQYFTQVFDFLKASHSPVEALGFQIFHVLPLKYKNECAVTHICGLDYKGYLPGWLCEFAMIDRAKAMSGLRSLILTYNEPGVYIPMIKDASNAEIISSGNAMAASYMNPSNLPGGESPFNFKVISRTTWPIPAFKLAKNGNLVFVDAALSHKLKGVILDILKSSGKSILEGRGIVGISLPVRIFEPMSLLERLANTWGLGPIFFNLAAASSNPLDRMKYAISFAVASLHSACFILKPFNPILGETFQAFWPDGSQIFMEHTSHHPPITHFCIEGPSKSYTFWGFYEFKGQLKGNSGTTAQDGPNYLQFPDGQVIMWTLPVAKMTGLIWGQKVFEWLGELNFVDERNQLKSTLKFGPDTRSSSNRSKVAPHVFNGTITKNGELISKIAGSWLSGIEFDGKRYWSLYDYEPFPATRSTQLVMPSDSRYREDAFYLSIKDESESQKWKLTLEAKQRKDRSSRINYRKLNGIPDPYCT